MKTIWFSIRKDKIDYFLDITKIIISPEDLIIRIKNSDSETITDFIREGYLDETDEWVLFVDNWKRNKYLIKLTYDDVNNYFNMEMLKTADRKSFWNEIDLINEKLNKTVNRYYKFIGER